jgi:hypothetical protein
LLSCLPIQAQLAKIKPSILRRLLLGSAFSVNPKLQLVFTTSGVPSTPLPLIPLAAGGNAIGKRQLTLMTRVSDYGGLFSVFLGDLDGRKVVAKMTDKDELGEVLRHERLIYQHLSDLQGSVVPTCYGLFTVEASHLLITEDCGVSLTSFSTLSNHERCVVFVSFYDLLLTRHKWPTDRSCGTSS